jgi:glycosyltransferase involved in cell wall biosynthesis
MAETGRRVLLPCYWFPPVPSVGSVRVGALARYLPRHGWQAVVVTPRRPGVRPDGIEIHETEDRDRAATLKRRFGMRPDLALKDQVAAGAPDRGAAGALRAAAIEVGKALVAFPDANRGWVPLAVAAAERAASAGRVDAILTSSPPVSVHLAGRRLRERLGVPWIADLRDLWSQDHNSAAPAWRRGLERRLERATFRHADALVTVSEPLAAQLRGLHPGARVHAILNGFDPERTGLATPSAERFTICHTGTFYQGRRDPTLFLDTLAGLLRAGRLDRARVRVQLVSRQESWLVDLVRRLGLEDVVDVLAWVPWDEALRMQQQAQVLLLLHWGGPAEAGVYTGKVFEYLAARRPILVVGGGEGVLTDLLRDTGAGVQVSDREALERTLLGWFAEFEAGGVRYRGDASRLERYSHARMAAEFAAVLDDGVDRAVRRH